MKEIFLLCFLTLCSVVSAKTYFVAPNGIDSNPGTLALPWKTWSKAFTSRSAGDTVYFRGGVYPTTVTNGLGIAKSINGSAGNYICFFAYNNEVPILDCDNVTTATNGHNYGFSLSGSYFILKGLTVRNVWQLTRDLVPAEEIDVITIFGSNIYVENCTAYNSHGVGFTFGGTNVRVTNCDSYNHCDSLTAEANYPGNNGYGFFQYGTSINGSVYYKNCRAWNCGDDGWTLVDPSYVELDGCWSFRNGMLKGGGNGFKLGFVYTSANSLGRVVKKCIAAYNRAGGISCNDNSTSAQSMQIYNNISYHNGYSSGYLGGTTAYGFRFYNTSSSDADEFKRVVKNNISYDNDGPYRDGDYDLTTGALITHAYNSWNTPPGVTISDADFVSIDSTGLSGARGADGSLPDLKGFLKLKSTSKAVNAGVNVGLPFIGTAPDLGAYEYDPLSVPNKFPTIAITSPSNGSIYTAPASITISANASDADGTISKVEFFNGAFKLGEKTSTPWSFTWSNVAEGTYTLTAVATDNGNAKTTSASVTITVNKPTPVVNQPPVVSIAAPLTGNKFTVPAQISVTADVSDADGLITKVEFFSGTVKLGEKTTSPWTFAWNNVTSGTYSLSAVATDNLGSKTTSSTVSITVISPPVITISSPVSGNTFTAPASISITANATDADGTIVKVEFLNGAAKLGEKSSAPWSLDWNNVPVGTYSLTALATDNSGEKTTSAAVSVTVNTSPPVTNNPPVIDITYPAAGSTFEIPVNITIAAEVTDSDGTIMKVEFFNGANKLGEKTTAPWEFQWNNLQSGTHSLTTVATDNLNAKATSSAVSITVNDIPPVINLPPVVSIIKPAKGQRFKKFSDIILDATASDLDGTISKVEFYSGNDKLAEISKAPYSFTWEFVTEGIYSISVVATDNLNASTYSSPVWLEVEADSAVDIISEDFNLYPNPNNGNFSLVLLQPLQDEKHEIRIVTLDGRTIHTESFIREEILKQFYLSFLMPGTYILVLLNNREIVNTKKFIKY